MQDLERYYDRYNIILGENDYVMKMNTTLDFDNTMDDINQEHRRHCFFYYVDVKKY